MLVRSTGSFIFYAAFDQYALGGASTDLNVYTLGCPHPLHCLLPPPSHLKPASWQCDAGAFVISREAYHRLCRAAQWEEDDLPSSQIENHLPSSCVDDIFAMVVGTRVREEGGRQRWTDQKMSRPEFLEVRNRGSGEAGQGSWWDGWRWCRIGEGKMGHGSARQGGQGGRDRRRGE